MTHQSLISIDSRQHPMPREANVLKRTRRSERTVGILKLLTAQIALLQRVQKQQHARVRPEIEEILNSDPWRERAD